MLELKLPNDWKNKKIGEVAKEISDRNESNDDVPVLSCTKYNGLVDSMKYFGRRVFSEDISKYKLVPRNHFAYATNHIEEGSIGYQNYYDKAVVSPIYTVFKTSIDVDDAYLYFLFKTELYRHLFDINTSASVDRRGSLRWKEFSKITIPVPPLWEQKKIADILLTWDKAIELLGNLIDVKIRFKKDLIRRLLFNEFFQSKEINEYALGDLGKTYSGLNGKDKNDFGQGKPYIGYKNIFSNSKVNTINLDLVNVKTNEKQNAVHFGDIFFTVSSETPEEVGMSSVLLEEVDEMYLNSFCFGYRLNDFSKLIPDFARFLFRGTSFRKEVYRLAQGYTRYNLSKKEVMKIKIKLPTIVLQQKIARILSVIEVEQIFLINKLNYLKIQKKGLMQKLLTGRIRVRI